MEEFLKKQKKKEIHKKFKKRIENKELKTYKMTPSIEKYKDIIIKELEKEEYFGTPPNF